MGSQWVSQAEQNKINGRIHSPVDKLKLTIRKLNFNNNTSRHNVISIQSLIELAQYIAYIEHYVYEIRTKSNGIAVLCK